MSFALHSAAAGSAQMRSIPSKQLSQRWTPSQARRCVVLAASSPPPMRSFDFPMSSSNGSSSSTSTIPSAAAPSAAAAAPASPGDASYRSYRVSPWAAMKFNGPVPERVNGRLAMLAFLYIAQHEAKTGQTVLQQALDLPYNYAAWPLVALMLLMVYATFPPALAGAREEDFGIFSVAAEKTNGRAAMLGLAVLAALEWHSGFAFF
ncbi:hypothetical protein ABPG77_002092 [Micractinium sp. CCAP 211/92]